MALGEVFGGEMGGFWRRLGINSVGCELDGLCTPCILPSSEVSDNRPALLYQLLSLEQLVEFLRCEIQSTDFRRDLGKIQHDVH